jgi:hypothetical protein
LVAKNKSGSTQNELVQCDLEFPALQEQLRKIQNVDLEILFTKIENINQMTWSQVHATSSKGKGKRGLNWEVLPSQKTSSGGTIASIRITDKFRARVSRDGVFMRFISLHPDHDSAYKAKGGEEI